MAHELHVWRPKPKPQFIEARDGGFWLDGKPWKAQGVNYIPASGIGVNDLEFFEYWLDRAPYDPEIVDRDLRRIKAMNLNSISAFIHHRSIPAQNLLDLVRRCEELGLRVNLSLRPGTPLEFRWDEMKAIIEHYRLATNDTVFAYDLAWEPWHGDYGARRKYNADWAVWIAKRYGSMARPRRRGACPCRAITARSPCRQNSPVVPRSSCPWPTVAFLDDLLAAHYGAARQLVRSIDPRGTR